MPSDSISTTSLAIQRQLCKRYATCCIAAIDQSTPTVSAICWPAASTSFSLTSPHQSSEPAFCGCRHTGLALSQLLPTMAAKVRKVLTTMQLKPSPVDVLPATVLHSSAGFQPPSRQLRCCPCSRNQAWTSSRWLATTSQQSLKWSSGLCWKG